MGSRAEEAAESVARIRLRLLKVMEANDGARQPLVEVLQLLEPLESYLRRELARGSGRKSDQTGTRYTIERKKNEAEVLTEHRGRGASQPYKCPRYVFDRAVEVIAGADPAMEFEEVLQGVAKKLPDPTDWQVRVVLRFLMNAKPPLIVRERNKYRPLHPKKLVAEAGGAWAALANASKG